MKHKYLTAVSFFLSALSAAAQTPGGVDGPTVWSRDSASVRVAAGTGLTYIGVSKVYGEKEQTIWSLGSGKAVTRMQTTERAANLGDGTFMNYAKDTLSEMRLYSYTTSSSVGGGQTLHIGRNGDTRLPVRNLDGRTVEYAVFDRRLSDAERCRVESCLALKYGVSLRSSYLNSRSEVIWNGYANKAYSHRIAGLISDKASALHKTRARSCEEDGFLTVSMNRPLQDGESILWGDDNGRLSFRQSRAYGKWLGRRWMDAATRISNPSVDIAADSRQLRQIRPLSEGESYYLAIDPTGTGSFPVKDLSYHKADRVTADSIVFRDVPLGSHSVFTLRAARDMFTTIEVVQPTEKSGDTGALSVRVTGGIAPYRLTLRRGQTSVFDRTTGDSIQSADGLMEGKYLLTTTDHVGNKAENEFQISKTGITEIPSMNPSDGNGDFFANVSAGPNPTADGYVGVQVELGEAATLDMALYTAGGALVSRRTYLPDTYFSTKVYLPQTGVYLLILQSGSREKTFKLMRK